MRAANRVDFEKVMAAIHDLKPAAYKWLMDNDPSTLACHTIDPFFKTDHVTNNIAESWNGVLNEYRRKPIIDLLKYIRMKLMKRLIRRREKAANWDSNLPPRMHKKLVKIAKSSRNLWVVKASIKCWRMMHLIRKGVML